MSAADNIIEVRDVTMRFGGLTAVSQLDIRIPRGGILPGSGFGSRVGGCFLGGIGAGRGRL